MWKVALRNVVVSVMVCTPAAAAEFDHGQATKETKEPRCWEGKEERNTDSQRNAVPPLPDRFDGAAVSRTSVAIKLCIESDGGVSRALVLRSSGNPEVDAFYVDELRKWKFTPLKKRGRAIPSVRTTLVSWNPR